jgi:2'-5' RNA ligase
MKYLVAIPIPQPAAAALAQIQDSLRPPEWRITMPPHITLLAPDTPTLEPEAAKSEFMAAPITQTRFVWETGTITTFERRNRNTVVLLPADSSPLKMLFNQLLISATWQKTGTSTGREYTPHITLVNQVPTHDLPAAMEDLRSTDLVISFTIDAIRLYNKQSSWLHWKIVAEKELENPELQHKFVS